jgi:hypothetical protein
MLDQAAVAHVFHLALVCDPEYSLHEAAPFGVGLRVVGNNRPTLEESLRIFN